MGLLTWLVLISVFDIYLSFSHFLFFFSFLMGKEIRGRGVLSTEGEWRKR